MLLPKWFLRFDNKDATKFDEYCLELQTEDLKESFPCIQKDVRDSQTTLVAQRK